MEHVSATRCSAADVEKLQFDRLTNAWRPVFTRAALFLRGVNPDVRAGNTESIGLLFDMERLFEAFVGATIRRQWHAANEGRVVLQGPQRHFASASVGSAFRMRPDISVMSDDGSVVRIYDAKWKRLHAAAPNRGISREDIYQMASYAGRYGCRHLALLYPRGDGQTPGRMESFQLQSPGLPYVEVYVLDLLELARGKPAPEGLGPHPAT